MMIAGEIHLFAEKWLAARLARGEIVPSTRRDLLARLASLAVVHGTRPIDELDRETILAWQASTGHLSPATRRAYLSTVRCFCEWLVIEDYLPADPTVGVRRVREPRRVPRALPVEAIARILAAAPDARGLAILWLEVGCGLRCCEVASLDVADYDPRSLTLAVRGKNGDQRVVPVPAETAGALNGYLDTVGWQAGPLVRSQVRGSRGQRLSRGRVSRLVGEYMTAAGVHTAARDGRSAHALRHTCASDVLDACHDLRIVQQLLGHQSLATTQVYLRRADLGQLRRAMAGRNYDQAS